MSAQPPAKRAKTSQGASQGAGRIQGPDPTTPSLDKLVDSPKEFMVGFHSDGAVYVADAYGTKSKVWAGGRGRAASPRRQLPISAAAPLPAMLSCLP